MTPLTVDDPPRKSTSPRIPVAWLLSPSLSEAEQPAPRRGRAYWAPVALVLVVWVAARILFFQGFCGSDDLRHVEYAQNFYHPPANHWETRLLFNLLLNRSMRWFGSTEFAFALPGLLGSLLLSGATLSVAGRFLGRRGLLVSGLLVSTLPLDVFFCSVPFANSVAVGLASLGTALLVLGGGKRWYWLAPVAFALGILAHPTTVFYVLAICGGFFLGARPGERLRPLAAGVLSLGLYLAAELTVFWLCTGDPLYQIHMVNNFEKGQLKPDRLFTLGWFSFPFRALCFSKEFSVLLAAAILSGWRLRRKLPRELLCLAGASLLYWLWISYGSSKPTSYVPFWRLPRYYYPLAMPLCLVVGSYLSTWRRWSMAGTGLLVSLNLLLLAASGSFGQGIEISREFLRYVRSQPETVFLTDHRTFRELTVHNQGQALDNVYSLRAVPGEPTRSPAAVFLWNPLNRKKLPDEVKVGAIIYRTRPQVRQLGQLIPVGIRSKGGWWTRRPAALALTIEGIFQPSAASAEADPDTAPVEGGF